MPRARRARDAPFARGEPLDLRLAAGATAAWGAVLWALHLTAGGALTVAGGAAAAALIALAARRRWAGATALAFALLCVALTLLPLGGRLWLARGSPLARWASEHASVTATLTVTADPVQLAAKGIAGAPRVSVATAGESMRVDGRSVAITGAVRVVADASGWLGVIPGQRVQVVGEVVPDLSGSALSVGLFARAPPQLIGRPPWAQRVAEQIRGGLREAAKVLPDQEGGLLPGLIDGDISRLDPVLAERFKLAGLTHLVAVSGTNCSILIGAVLLGLRRARVRPWINASVAGAVLVMFVLVARPSPSVLRAALMAAITLWALASGRPRAAIPALSAAVLALLMWDPTLAESASFQMSVLATAALLLVAPGWADRLRARGVPIGVAESIAVAAAAHAVTAPVVAAISGQVSVVAIAANALAEPVVAVITVLGFGAALVAPGWMTAATGLVWVAGWPCRWLVGVADFFGGLHGATIPWPGGLAGGLSLAGVLGVTLLLALHARLRTLLAAAAVTAVVIFIPVRAVTSPWPPGGWLFAACDVGQGDALLLRAGPATAVQIDAGPDPVAMDRCLRDLDIDAIPLLFVTHLHIDHVAGLPGTLRGRRVGQILVSPLAEPQVGADILRRETTSHGIAVSTPEVGARYTVGAATLEVLSPRVAYRGTHSDPNNSSIVLRATVGRVRILLTGDAEIEAQRRLLASGADVRAEVLKVPHHGSAYSDPQFLAAVRAQLSVVSVGVHNDYGHPSPVLLAEMRRLGVPVLRTDRDGDVAVTGEPGSLVAVAHGSRASVLGKGAPALAPKPGGAVADPPTAQLAAASAVDARMTSCRPARSKLTTCPTRCPAPCCSSGTRSCWSIAPSARSPPRRAAAIRSWSRPSSPGPLSRARSCTSCSDRPSSVTAGCWSCDLRRISGRQRRPC